VCGRDVSAMIWKYGALEGGGMRAGGQWAVVMLRGSFYWVAVRSCTVMPLANPQPTKVRFRVENG
jgi:hypothetical protein